ncbi:XdhC family protein [Maribacter vaceletii]|nr:XdhC/CoxI family protein [Maribacter vaceletii]
MIHEFKNIVESNNQANKEGYKTVLATVVALDGSSYRRPGVQMLIWENGKFTGAVSGGCVEKEIKRQAATVFSSGTPKIMTYDGRFRLGCEGVLYILIEPFKPSQEFLEVFAATIKNRKGFSLSSYYNKKDGVDNNYGTLCFIDKKTFSIQGKQINTTSLLEFTQEMAPSNKLLLIGAEHDAVQLCSFATALGWDVTIITSPLEEKDILDFPGAKNLIAVEPEMLSTENIDTHTAVMLMTHSYAKDLKYLLTISTTSPMYLGTLGPLKRREKLLHDFMEYKPDADLDFMENIHGPAGLDIGAETPQEIAISIMAEILAVVRDRKPIMLKDKVKGIHQ